MRVIHAEMGFLKDEESFYYSPWKTTLVFPNEYVLLFTIYQKQYINILSWKELECGKQIIFWKMPTFLFL